MSFAEHLGAEMREAGRALTGRADAFFAEAGRQLLIDQVIHHGSFTDDLVVLAGCAGVGKSEIVKVLPSGLHGVQFLALSLCDVLGIEALEAWLATSDEGRDILSSDANGLDEKRPVWFVVDNAELLLPEALAYLVGLFSRRAGLVLMLVVDDSSISSLRQMLKVPFQVFELAPLTRAETALYVEYWLESAGVAVRLDDAHLNQLSVQSQGLPSLINEYLSGWLIEYYAESQKQAAGSVAAPAGPDNSDSGVAGEDVPDSGLDVVTTPMKHKSFPRAGFAVSAIGVLLLTFAFVQLLLVDEEGDPVYENGVGDSGLGKRDQGSLVDRRRLTLELPVPSSKSQLEGAVEDKVGGEQSLGAVVSGKAGVQLSSAQPVSVEYKASLDAEADEQSQEGQVVDTPVARSQALIVPDVAIDPLSAAAQILQGLPDSAYVIQLMGGRSLEKVRTLESRLPSGLESHVYQRELKGSPWYVLVLSGYEGKESALLALASLPENIRKMKPWVKSLELVKQEILAGNS
jgi:hypothetical protein